MFFAVPLKMQFGLAPKQKTINSRVNRLRKKMSFYVIPSRNEYYTTQVAVRTIADRKPREADPGVRELSLSVML